jgi:hypothetical protein
VEDLFFHLLGERKIFNFVVCLPLSSLVFDKKKIPENFLFHLIPEENEHAKQKGKNKHLSSKTDCNCRTNNIF